MSTETHINNSRPAGPSFVEIDDVATIPKGTAGSQDRRPGVWAKLLWETQWKVPVNGMFLKGSLLPKMITMKAVRELMARPGFFWSGKREEERIRDRVANVESAFIQCLGEVQDPQCDSCIKLNGPWVC